MIIFFYFYFHYLDNDDFKGKYKVKRISHKYLFKKCSLAFNFMPLLIELLYILIQFNHLCMNLYRVYLLVNFFNRDYTTE